MHGYFDMEDRAQHITTKSGNKKAGVPGGAPVDELYFTPEMIDHIKESRQEIKEGKSTVIRTKEELNTFFDWL